MRPSKIKVGELKKSKEFQTHATENCGAHTGCDRLRCRPGHGAAVWTSRGLPACSW